MEMELKDFTYKYRDPDPNRPIRTREWGFRDHHKGYWCSVYEIYHPYQNGSVPQKDLARIYAPHCDLKTA